MPNELSLSPCRRLAGLWRLVLSPRHRMVAPCSVCLRKVCIHCLPARHGCSWQQHGCVAVASWCPCAACVRVIFPCHSQDRITGPVASCAGARAAPQRNTPLEIIPLRARSCACRCAGSMRTQGSCSCCLGSLSRIILLDAVHEESVGVWHANSHEMSVHVLGGMAQYQQHR